jgi:type II secretory pathway component GspD/PulD (secretin)
MRIIKKQLILIILLTVSATTLFADVRKKYKMIPLQSIQFATVKKICEPMLSPGGKLVYERSRKSVLIYDTPEKIAKIEQFIKSADRPPVNIRIELIRQSTAPSRNVYIGQTPKRSSRYSKKYPAKVTIKGGKANIKFYNKNLTGKKHQNFHISDRSSTVNRNISSFIMTASGEPASLWVGTSMIDPSWLRASRRHPTVIIVDGTAPTVIEAPPDDIKYSDVGVSLQVLPTYYDSGLINVKIYPEISYLVGGKKKSVKVETLITQVTVRSGQRVFIGGVMSAKSTQYRELFGRNFFTRSDVAEIMNMYLIATASTPGKSIPGGSGITNDWIPRGRIIKRR